jgi:hypothetical protein
MCWIGKQVAAAYSSTQPAALHGQFTHKEEEMKNQRPALNRRILGLSFIAAAALASATGAWAQAKTKPIVTSLPIEKKPCTCWRTWDARHGPVAKGKAGHELCDLMVEHVAWAGEGGTPLPAPAFGKSL